MNTVKSFWLGWASLCVAGAGAYYFAKREINAERQAKLEQTRRQKQEMQAMQDSQQMQQGSGPPTKHESAASYRSPKGDRFS